MRMLKLHIEYDGSGFCGWQFQTNGRSVQGVVEDALSQLLREQIRITGAGRTDAGVHATGQVAHFSTSHSMSPARILRGLNALLPEDVVVHDVEAVPELFHARYGAAGRRYRYSISKEPVALGRDRIWVVGYELDFEKMQRCAEKLIGEHDFTAFAKVGSNVRHHRCVISYSSWTQKGTMLLFDITSNRFLHGMVRALVGTMVDVGRGHCSEKDFDDLLALRGNKHAGMAAPAKGLVLEEVMYPGGEQPLEVESGVSEASEE